jgi:hypothetical protein
MDDSTTLASADPRPFPGTPADATSGDGGNRQPGSGASVYEAARSSRSGFPGNRDLSVGIQMFQGYDELDLEPEPRTGLDEWMR